MTDDRSTEAAEPAAPPIRLLIVDNDEALARAMEESLAKVGYECIVATSGPEGARRIDTDSFDLVVTDLVMNDIDGMEILARAREKLPDAEVILVTGHATVPKAVEAMQQGAFNFLEKPITTSRLRAVCEKAADAIRLKRQNVELRERLDERFGFEGIIYTSSQMQTVIDRLKEVKTMLAGQRNFENEDYSIEYVKTMIVANKIDADGAADRLEIVRELASCSPLAGASGSRRLPELTRTRQGRRSSCPCGRARWRGHRPQGATASPRRRGRRCSFRAGGPTARYRRC